MPDLRFGQQSEITPYEAELICNQFGFKVSCVVPLLQRSTGGRIERLTVQLSKPT
jgi:hypothetical protein